MVEVQIEHPPYEAPALRTLGSVHELTEAGSRWGDKCFANKTIGPPDFIHWIPIANCSS
jgi:hypothetical protein